MMYVVTYLYDGAATEQMDATRPRHRDFLRSLHSTGALRAAGPWVEGGPGAYLLMDGDSPEEVLTTLDGDPFWQEGLILNRSVQSWNPVIGDLA